MTLAWLTSFAPARFRPRPGDGAGVNMIATVQGAIAP
jgi:hypothetical protein